MMITKKILFVLVVLHILFLSMHDGSLVDGSPGSYTKKLNLDDISPPPDPAPPPMDFIPRCRDVEPINDGDRFSELTMSMCDWYDPRVIRMVCSEEDRAPSIHYTRQEDLGWFMPGVRVKVYHCAQGFRCEEHMDHNEGLMIAACVL